MEAGWASVQRSRQCGKFRESPQSEARLTFASLYFCLSAVHASEHFRLLPYLGWHQPKSSSGV
jgi:hypothetical protein